MRKEKATHRPAAPKAAHLPAHGMRQREELPTRGEDLMAVGEESIRSVGDCSAISNLPRLIRHTICHGSKKYPWMAHLYGRRYPSGQPVLDPLNTASFFVEPEKLSNFCRTSKTSKKSRITINFTHARD